MRALALLLSLSAASAFAEVPFAEAKELTEAKMRANTNDAVARFAYGRVLLHGFAYGTTPIPADLVDGKLVWPKDASIRMVRVQDSLPTAEEAGFLKEATKQFMRAARVDSSSGIYALANAFAFEQLGTHHASVLGNESFGDFPDRASIWEKVEAEYRRAYSIAKDRDKRGWVKGPDSPVSAEAARALIRLNEDKRIELTKAEIGRLQALLKALGFDGRI